MSTERKEVNMLGASLMKFQLLNGEYTNIRPFASLLKDHFAK